MNTINKLTFRALVALAVAVLFQTSLTRADEPGKAGEESQGAAKITFIKYVNSVLNLPGLMATVKGVGEGDAGDFLFEGEVFKTGGPRPPGQVVAMYHINGTKHSLSVLIEGLQPVGGIGLEGYDRGRSHQRMAKGSRCGRRMDGDTSDLCSGDRFRE